MIIDKWITYIELWTSRNINKSIRGWSVYIGEKKSLLFGAV